MAVSQGKMLGHYSWGPGGYRCSCCKADSTRPRKVAERREVEREISAERREPQISAADLTPSAPGRGIGAADLTGGDA